MTLHTVAMVLKQSVVFSMGRFLFCRVKKERARVRMEFDPLRVSDVTPARLTSDTNLVVPSLNVFSMGVASA